MKIREAVVTVKAQYLFCDCGGQLKYSHRHIPETTFWKMITNDAKTPSDIWVCVRCGKDESMGYSPEYMWPKLTYWADSDEAVEVKP